MPDRARDIVWGRVKEESTANIDGLDGRTYCAPAFGDLMMLAVWIYSVKVQDTAYIGMSCGSIFAYKRDLFVFADGFSHMSPVFIAL